MTQLLRLLVFCALWLAAGVVLADAPRIVDEPRMRESATSPASPGDLAAYIASHSSLPEVSAVLIDPQTGEVLEAFRPDAPMTPASVTKLMTTLYAFDRLGMDYRFRTRVRVTGPIKAGIVQGDLVLEGGGDPALDSDELAGLVDQLANRGIKGVTGRLLYYEGALPSIRQIHPGQPPHAAYNPGISGLNVNFNRVYLEWDLSADAPLSLSGRAEHHAPKTRVISVTKLDRTGPIFDYENQGGRDHWSVATAAIRKPGARWLPVRDPAPYAADLFRTLAAAKNILLPRPTAANAYADGEIVAEHQRRELRLVCRGMLHFSTNLTAEVVGLMASGGMLQSLAASGAEMSDWASATYSVEGLDFRDHSGLSPDTRITAQAIARIVASPDASEALDGILRRYFVPSGKKGGKGLDGAEVRAKTGTLNFVRGLAGYLQRNNGKRLAFAIFSRDPAKRASTDHSQERPAGARAYSRRAVALEQAILRRWLLRYSG